jgi:ABC-type multidrug transport system permease subunit
VIVRCVRCVLVHIISNDNFVHIIIVFILIIHIYCVLPIFIVVEIELLSLIFLHDWKQRWGPHHPKKAAYHQS